MKKGILYLFSFLWLSVVFPQNDSIAVPVDKNSSILQREINDLNKRYTGEEFNYETNTGESKNLLSRFINWLFKSIANAIGIDISPDTLLILQYIIYGLLGLLAIYLLVRAFINENFTSIFSKTATPVIDIDLSEQHIEAIDLDSLMSTALKSKDYRLAVRYQFLKILKLLSQKEIIEWHYDKTNGDYEREIMESGLKANFKKVSYLYEHIWYGEQIIDEVGYTNASSRFTQLNNLIVR